MSIEQKLNSLFSQWKAAQAQAGQALGLAHPDWFFPDGLVGEESDWQAAPVKVLYVLKESNAGEQPGDFRFWFKRVVASGEEHNIKRRLALLQEIVAGNADLRAAAYMNLNKSGGFAVTDDRQLAAYANRFAALIREEIESLAPDVIVCGGCYGLVRDILGESFTGRVIDMWHPSYWRKSDAVYASEFRERWEERE